MIISLQITAGLWNEHKCEHTLSYVGGQISER